jgi:DNA polymerase-1
MMTSTLPFPAPPSSWTPSAPPSLDGVSTVAIDLETTGLKWWEDDRPIGISITTSKGTQYLPFGHAGGNLDEAVVKEWARREIRGKHLLGLNLKFDLHFMREWGVDLELQGCSVSDIAHTAALLDDHRTRFSLDRLVRDYLGETKIGADLDPTKFSELHAGSLAPRAEADSRQVWDLEQLLAPRLADEGLQRVKLLENQVLWVVCDMEKNGCPIDLDLLDTWTAASEQDYLRLLWQIYRASNMNVNPASPQHLAVLCRKLQLPITETEDGRPSFTNAVLSAYHHPITDLVCKARKLASLRSKYLLKYQASVDSSGLLRYALHQLRADEGGTVTGRFSSSALMRGVGVNIQQVPSCERQRDAIGPDYLIRSLHRPASGQWLSADASQIEYRLFAGLSGATHVIAEYEKNPALSFHHVVWEQMKKLTPISYADLKTLNFAKLYGGGTARIASMLGLITPDQHATLKRTHAGSDHPLLKTANDVMQLYDRVLPEVAAMLAAATRDAQRDGFVTTALGRRARLDQKHFRALNRIVQGTAADLQKLKLVELHSQRQHTGLLLRFSVHDSIEGDCPDQQCADAVKKILNTQSLDTQIPILWDVSTGDTWGEC